jgi:hypothetical protein
VCCQPAPHQPHAGTLHTRQHCSHVPNLNTVLLRMMPMCMHCSDWRATAGEMYIYCYATSPAVLDCRVRNFFLSACKQHTAGRLKAAAPQLSMQLHQHLQQLHITRTHPDAHLPGASPSLPLPPPPPRPTPPVRPQPAAAVSGGAATAHSQPQTAPWTGTGLPGKRSRQQ